jgi:hypothetical protein
MKLIAAIIICACIALAGCTDHVDYAIDDGPFITGDFTFCDYQGCRDVFGTYYYNPDGYIVYWDRHFSTWVGPNCYWDGSWHVGAPRGFAGYYRHEYYYGGYSHNGYRGPGPGRGGRHGQ